MTLLHAEGIAEPVRKMYKNLLLLGKITKEEYESRLERIDKWIDLNVGSNKLITLGVWNEDSRG